MPFVDINKEEPPVYQEYKLKDGTTFKLPKSPAHNLTSIKRDPWAEAVYLQKQREQHQQEQMILALLVLAAIVAAVFIFSKRRAIFAASENAMVSTLATGVKAKRRAQAYSDRIKTRVVEKADGEKNPPRPGEWQ